ncbi:unnamed protein product [Soboliphyme baturini]|uniref:Uncharacterized protein n=1 Tax=Soboliphyme baturini TaxID=241478 RepID=A0A183IYF0_9BILA|nr:unnamed protein product [Soboliphyme baturini]
MNIQLPVPVAVPLCNKQQAANASSVTLATAMVVRCSLVSGRQRSFRPPFRLYNALHTKVMLSRNRIVSYKARAQMEPVDCDDGAEFRSFANNHDVPAPPTWRRSRHCFERRTSLSWFIKREVQSDEDFSFNGANVTTD